MAGDVPATAVAGASVGCFSCWDGLACVASRGGARSSLMKDQPAHIVGDVDDADFDPCPSEADGSDFHSHAVLLIGEHMLDEGADL